MSKIKKKFFEIISVVHLGDLRVACRCGDPKAGGGTDITKIVQENAYDPWGLTFGTTNEAQTPTALTNRYTFLDREKQTDLGLNWQYLINRNYDYQTGRFMSVDPVIEGQENYSTYQYSYNNPILYSDPDGRCASCWQAIKDWINAPIGVNAQQIGRAYMMSSTGVDVTPKTRGQLTLAVLGQAGQAFGNRATPGRLGIPNTRISTPRTQSAKPQLALSVAKPSERMQAGLNKATVAAEGTSGEGTRFVTGASVKDKSTGTIQTGTVDTKPTMDRIQSGGTNPHRNDGTVFQNRPDRITGLSGLPSQPLGYYNEFVVPSPNITNVGPQRIVVGSGGDAYYTPDHYGTFIKIK
jgi:RHS repeat-associated protein